MQLPILFRIDIPEQPRIGGDCDWAELRHRMMVPEADRAKFWAKMFKANPAKAPAAHLAVLKKAMPDRAIVPETVPRTAGLGSLGRPRWVGRAGWRASPARVT